MAVGPRLDKAGERGRSIVVVDDDPSVREVCADALLEAGYRVNVFGGGEEALRALTGDIPDLLVVDWNMPGLDGLEIARRARAIDPGMPVLMITGNRVAAIGVAERAGVLHVLAKPFLLEDLLAAVSALAGTPTS